MTDGSAQTVKELPLKEKLTPEGLKELVNYLKVLKILDILARNKLASFWWCRLFTFSSAGKSSDRWWLRRVPS